MFYFMLTSGKVEEMIHLRSLPASASLNLRQQCDLSCHIKARQTIFIA